MARKKQVKAPDADALTVHLAATEMSFAGKPRESRRALRRREAEWRGRPAESECKGFALSTSHQQPRRQFGDRPAVLCESELSFYLFTLEG